jgi:hypothetical protein
MAMYGSIEDHRPFTAVRIPDTVVYHSQYPIIWFFFSKDGHVKRKNAANVRPDTIFQSFSARRGRKSSNEIIAQYLYPRKDEDDNDVIAVEYLDELQLRHFLFNERQRDAGILQKFSPPSSKNNSMLHVRWSSRVCLVERRENRHAIDDSRYTINERAVTFDGAEHLSELRVINKGQATLVQRVRQSCAAIAEHVESITQSKIQVPLSFDADSLWSRCISSLCFRLCCPFGRTSRFATCQHISR